MVGGGRGCHGFWITQQRLDETTPGNGHVGSQMLMAYDTRTRKFLIEMNDDEHELGGLGFLFFVSFFFSGSSGP